MTLQEKRREQFDRRLMRCKHYTGISKETCSAGILYESVKSEDKPPFVWPCLHDGQRLPCQKREYYSAEEITSQEKQAQQIISNVVTVRRAIVEATKGKRTARGKLPCPICKAGEVGYSVFGSGRIYAECSTAGCISWVE